MGRLGREKVGGNRIEQLAYPDLGSSTVWWLMSDSLELDA